MYTIGEVAQITGMSRDRLRYYEEKGILKPKYDTSNNYREYDWEDLDVVLTIEFYRSMNFSTKSINSICENSSDSNYDDVISYGCIYCENYLWEVLY